MSSNDLDTTRVRIIDAAGEIFAERGFEGTTVRDICQRAGANVAAVNYYFGDKQRLYVETVLQAHRWRMELAALPEWTAETPAKVKLTDFIRTFIRRVRSGPGETWHTPLLMREMMLGDAACVEVVRESIRPQHEILVGILRELLPSDASLEQLHLTSFSVVGQCLFYHFADPVVRNLVAGSEYADYDIDKLANHIIAFSLAAIERPRPARAGATP